MPQQILEKCNMSDTKTMNDAEQEMLRGYIGMFGQMTSTQALYSCVEQESIIAIHGQNTKDIQSVSKTKFATIRRDRLLHYALLLEKEELQKHP